MTKKQIAEIPKVRFFCCIIGMFTAAGLWIAALTWQWWGALSLKEGIVVSKEHTEAGVHTLYTDSGGGVIIPMLTPYPESWSVTIEGDDYKGKHKKRTVEVSYDLYKSLREGVKWRVE